MIHDANADLPHIRAWIGDLRVASETEIDVPGDQHLFIDRTVRLMARSAAFAKGLVHKHEGSRLVAMALRARLIPPGESKPAGRLEDVHAVWVMALDAVQIALHDRMMMGEPKLCVSFLMARETRAGFGARIDDERPLAATHLNVFAAGTVTRLTARLPFHRVVGHVKTTVRTSGE